MVADRRKAPRPGRMSHLERVRCALGQANEDLRCAISEQRTESDKVRLRSIFAQVDKLATDVGFLISDGNF